LYKNAIRIMGVRVGSPDIAGEKGNTILGPSAQESKKKGRYFP